MFDIIVWFAYLLWLLFQQLGLPIPAAVMLLIAQAWFGGGI